MSYAEARQELNELAALIGERQWAGGQTIPPFVKQPGHVIRTCKLTDAEKFEKLDKGRMQYGH